MWKNAGVALGAGLASALLFVVSAKGSLIAILFGHFATLPVIIAAFSYGHRAGLAAAAVGALAVAAPGVFGPVPAALYGIGLALPAWSLSYLATRKRRPAEGADLAGDGWTPIGWIVLWAATVSCAIILGLGAFSAWHFGGFSGAVAAAIRYLSNSLSDTDGVAEQVDNPSDLAGLLVRLLLLFIAPWLCLTLLVNLWLGGRISQMSQRLARPWPNVPDGLRLPRFAAAILAVCAGTWFLSRTSDNGIAAAAAAVGATLGLVFAMQGLAAAHVLTRGFPGRPAILCVIYALTLMVPPAIAGLALLGVVDSLSSLRKRRPPPKPPTKATGVSPWT